MKLLFVSSTQKDMKKERELLTLTLFPKMKNILEGYGEEFRLASLPFGVREKEIAFTNVTKRVIEGVFHPVNEISPYMIFLLGEKYGWINEKEILKISSLASGKDNNYKDSEYEIDYLSLIKKKYNNRVLFYVRDLNKEDMDDEGREIFEPTSCLEKEKMRDLLGKIKKQFPKQVRYYKARYNKDIKDIEILDNLSLMIENDLKDLFLPSLLDAYTLEWQKRARIAPEYYFKDKSQNYYPSILTDDRKIYEGYLYSSYPILTIISGERGVGKTSYLCHDYSINKENKFAFVFKKDTYSSNLTLFIQQLIYKLEEILNLAHKGYEPIFEDNNKEINELINYLLFLVDKLSNVLYVYVDNASKDFLTFLFNIQFYHRHKNDEMYFKKIKLRFVVAFSNDVSLSAVCPFFDYSKRINIVRQEDHQIKKGILLNLIKSYQLDVSKQLMDIILSKKDSSSPLYLKMIVYRLYNDNRYKIKEETISEREKRLSDYLISLPHTIAKLSIFLIKELFPLYDEVFIKRTIMCIAYSFRRVNKDDIKDMFTYMRWEFNEDVFDNVAYLLNVVTSYSEYTDTYQILLDDNKNSVSTLLNNEVKEAGYLKYLGSFSSYYLSKEEVDKYLRISLKLALVRIDLALNEKSDEGELDLWMEYLTDVINNILSGFAKERRSNKYTSIAISEVLTWAIINGFDKALLLFIGFANNLIKSNSDYTPLFKGFFYYIKTDYAKEKEISKIVKFFSKVLSEIESNPYFGDFNNDFAVWLKVKFTIVKVRYYSIISTYQAKEELDKLLAFFDNRNIYLPAFYKMQIYSAYLIVCAKSKDKEMFEDTFKDNIFNYFPFDDASNLKYLRKESLETIYKSKIQALITLALAHCYGDSMKNTFVPLLDRACQTFEKFADDYELTHFNSATYTALIGAEALATPMYHKDVYVLNSFRYDARKYYPDSYFILEAEASYFYWSIMMDDTADKETLYLKYLSRRKALAFNSGFSDAFRLYTDVYAEYINYKRDDLSFDHKYHLKQFYDGIIEFLSLVDNENHIIDSLNVFAEFFECAKYYEEDKLVVELIDKLRNNKCIESNVVKDSIEYIYRYYYLEDDVYDLAYHIMDEINNDSENKKYTKLKSLFSSWEI